MMDAVMHSLSQNGDTQGTAITPVPVTPMPVTPMPVTPMPVTPMPVTPTPVSRETGPVRPVSSLRARQGGFSFIEVLIALSILLVGSLSVLSLFSAGVSMAVKRRLDVRAAQAQREVKTIVQGIVDEAAPGKPLQDVKDYPLVQRGYTVDIRFRSPAGGTPGVHAVPTLRFQGRAVRVLFPIPGIRSTLDPTAETDATR